MKHTVRSSPIVIEHVADPHGPADIARAIDLILRAADRRRAERLERVAYALRHPERQAEAGWAVTVRLADELSPGIH